MSQPRTVPYWYLPFGTTWGRFLNGTLIADISMYYIDDVAIDKFREKINNLSFGEFAEGKEDVLRFIHLCSAKAAEISRLN
jgi:hypothetical protein